MTPHEDLEYGYDFAFAPVAPLDPEYRQVYAAAQSKWLELWQPKDGAWVQ